MHAQIKRSTSMHRYVVNECHSVSDDVITKTTLFMCLVHITRDTVCAIKEARKILNMCYEEIYFASKGSGLEKGIFNIKFHVITQ